MCELNQISLISLYAFPSVKALEKEVQLLMSKLTEGFAQEAKALGSLSSSAPDACT